MRLRLWRIMMLCLGCGAFGAVWATDIIVNRGVGVERISVASARAVFGMRQVKWPNGAFVRVFVLADRHPAHVSLCKEILNIYPYQLRQSWDRLVFSGMGQAPTLVESEAEMLTRVASTQGAIGYVSSAASSEKSSEKIRVIHVD